MSASDRILVIGPSWVGDMVMAQALYKLLRQRSPAAEIDVVAPPWSLPVLARMPEVASGIELAIGHGELGLRRRRRLATRLRERRYGRAIVLPRSAKAALVPWFARVPRRTGFRGEWRYGLLNDVRTLDTVLDQTVKRFVALGHEPAEPLPPVVAPELYPRLTLDVTNLALLRSRWHLSADAPLVALMPGAEYGPAKRWPASRYAAVAAVLAKRGADVVVLGSGKERSLGREITTAAADARVRDLCGETTLTDVVDLLGAAQVAVSNDSGLLHVAAAAGAPVVALYGSSSPAFTPPLSRRASVIYLGVACSPCFARECPLKHLRCLNEIEVPDVLTAIEKLRDARSIDV